MNKPVILRMFAAGALVTILMFLSFFANAADHGIPVLMYHSIADKKADPYCLKPQLFLMQLNTLTQQGFKTLTASELLDDWRNNRPIPPKSVVLTFDDGYEDNFTQAFPILKKFHLKATIFLATGFIGRKNYLTWNEIKQMYQSGLIDFESHTVHHPNLTKLSAEQQMNEFVVSKQMIESHLHNKVEIFAYPYGYHNRSMYSRLKNAGYKLAFDSDPGAARPLQGVYALHRIEVTPDKPFTRLLAGNVN